METILKIEGMSCGHCVKHASDALKKIDGVTAVEVSLEQKTAKVTATKEIDQSVFASAIDDAGYDFKGRVH